METAEQRPFGETAEGAVQCFTLRSGLLECEVLTYGATLRALRVPDRDGQRVDVLLGYDRLEDYRRGDKYLGAIVGRCANRIGGAAFSLNGREYRLAANEGANHLHGGLRGFDKRLWTVERADSDALTLSLLSPDGEEGYPGNLRVRVRYSLRDTALCIEYEAVSDADTLCNLTSHGYFNLSGHASGRVDDQKLCVFGDRYTPTDAGNVPTGAIAPVEGTPLALRDFQPIGARCFDHNYLLNGPADAFKPAAAAFSPRTGILMSCWTDRPAMQLYTGDFLGGGPAGKGGAVYGDRCGFCLETPTCPDAVHHPAFPSAVLRAGETWRSVTVYGFGWEWGTETRD